MSRESQSLESESEPTAETGTAEPLISGRSSSKSYSSHHLPLQLVVKTEIPTNVDTWITNLLIILFTWQNCKKQM